MEKSFVLSTLCLLLFNCVVLIVSLTSDYWVYKSEGEISAYNKGLFKICAKRGEFKNCADIEDPPIELEVVKYLVIAGVVFSAIPIIIILLQVLVCVSGGKWLNVGALMLVVAGVFLIIGVALYVARVYMHDDNDFHDAGFSLHIGFALACVAVIVSFICAGLLNKMGPFMGTDVENIAI